MTAAVKSVALLALAAMCHGPKKPPVTAIEIVPSSVAVGPAASQTTFVLEARLWTDGPDVRLSITEDDGHSLKWTTNPSSWLVVDNQDGFKATFRTLSGTPPTVPVSVTVEAGGETSPPATISPVLSTLTGQDVLTAEYTAAMVPDVGLARGMRTTVPGSCELTLAAFVARSPLGQVIAKCTGSDGPWETAVLSGDDQATFVPETWEAPPPDDAPDAGSKQADPRSLTVVLHVLVGDGELDAAELATFRDAVYAQAEADVQLTNEYLSDNRAGIVLTHQKGTTDAGADPVEVDDCVSGDAATKSHDVAGVLNVYYVNALLTERGRACAWAGDRLQDVIYIGWEDHSGTALIHELGHTLGLMLPLDGHPDIVRGFDRTNVMTKGWDDSDPGGRRRLTVGQVFRMNADSASWLNRAPGPNNGFLRGGVEPHLACQCGTGDPEGPCPRLGIDIGSLSGKADVTQPWHCYDLLQLKQLDPDDDDAVSIAGGRRWRDPPGVCSDDVRGHNADHFSSAYVAVENLTRPGECPSWAAIFFQYHKVIRLDLLEPEVTWTQAADKEQFQNIVEAPVEVVVEVYSAPSSQALEEDRQHAGEVFGELNWSGLKLDFQPMPAGTPCQAPSTPGRLSLCYDSNLNAEGDAPFDRTARVSLALRKPTTVSHYLGLALGLDEVVAGAQGYDWNIMQALPDKRGTQLTLGQVYHANVKLDVLPACGVPKSCPPLSANVKR
jgi:hypothetical protein